MKLTFADKLRALVGQSLRPTYGEIIYFININKAVIERLTVSDKLLDEKNGAVLKKMPTTPFFPALRFTPAAVSRAYRQKANS